MRFENKVAMVTGASVGIGRACTVRLAKEGAKLVLFDINAEQLDKVKEEVAPYTTDVLTYTCDVSDEAAVNAAVADAMQHFGRIDVLINNAAIWRTWKTFMAVTTEEWKKFIDINVMGVVYCTRAVLGSMTVTASHCAVPAACMPSSAADRLSAYTFNCLIGFIAVPAS